MLRHGAKQVGTKYDKLACVSDLKMKARKITVDVVDFRERRREWWGRKWFSKQLLLQKCPFGQVSGVTWCHDYKLYQHQHQEKVLHF